jgi:hypothetical protein
MAVGYPVAGRSIAGAIHSIPRRFQKFDKRIGGGLGTAFNEHGHGLTSPGSRLRMAS